MTAVSVSDGLLAMAAFGFMGSLHCAAMCGALAGSACYGRKNSAPALTAYLLSRLLAYGILGFVAGLVGAIVVNQWLGELAEWLGVAFGILMLVYGLRELVRAIRPGYLEPPRAGGRWSRLSARAFAALETLPVPRPVALGIGTAILPCGFLLAAFVQTSLFAHPIWGMLAMIAFAVASSPALTGGMGLLALARRMGPRAAPATAAIMLIVAASSVLFRAVAPPHDHSHMDHSRMDHQVPH